MGKVRFSVYIIMSGESNRHTSTSCSDVLLYAERCFFVQVLIDWLTIEWSMHIAVIRFLWLPGQAMGLSPIAELCRKIFYCGLSDRRIDGPNTSGVALIFCFFVVLATAATNCTLSNDKQNKKRRIAMIPL